MIIDGKIPGDALQIAKAEQELAKKQATAIKAEEQPAEEAKDAKPAKTKKARAGKPVKTNTEK